MPAINGADQLIDWWLADVRHQFGDDWQNPDAPLMPSERFDDELGRCGRIGHNSLRRALRSQTERCLPAWADRLTTHVLRHYCATSPYGAGMDLKALQELLGHQWLAATSGYVHVCHKHAKSRGATRISGSRPALQGKGEKPVKWNLRMRAAERGILPVLLVECCV